MKPAACLLLLLAAWPSSVRASGALPTLDPRLAYALAPGAAPAPVWVTFVDKGERGPADLSARLAAAEAALTPEARRRRVRAGLHPLVDYLDLPVDPGYLASLADAGLQPRAASRWFNACAVQAAGEALMRLAALACVARLEPVPLAAPRRPEPPEAPGLLSGRAASPDGSAATLVGEGQSATQLARLGVTALHDSGYVGTGVMVCLLDDGFAYFDVHEATRDLQVGNRMRDFVSGGATLYLPGRSPEYDHGEWTLSTLGGHAPGTYLGPAWGATFALARTEEFATEKPVEMVNWALGAEWADSLGADIISSSLGYNLFPDSAGHDITYPMLDGHTTIVTRAAEIAASRGILVVNAMGNDGNNPAVPGGKLSAPADADSILSIAAVDSFGVRATFSSIGPAFGGRLKPDLAAQGVSVLTAVVTGASTGYERKSGTSLSAPLVAGLAACLMQARPNWTAQMVIRALRETASHPGRPDTLTGCGIPSGVAALRWRADTIGVPGGATGLAFAPPGPNPVRPADWPITLSPSLGPTRGPTPASLRVYDLRGRLVASPWSGTLQPGAAVHARWAGLDSQGRSLASGLYFLALETGHARVVHRLAVIR